MRFSPACLNVLILAPLCAFTLAGAAETNSPGDAELDRVGKVYGPYRITRLPITKGVTIRNPIKISRAPDGRMFAANQSGEVYVLRDTDGDGLEDEAALFCNVHHDGLNSPGGLAFRGDTVFVGTRQEIRMYRDTDGDGRADTSETFFNDFPHSDHPYEWTSGLRFGPDGSLYCTLATDSWNGGASPDPKGYRGSLLRIAADGKSAVRVAIGLRSAYGVAIDQHGQLYFTDNEGGGNPKEELNRLIAGRFYGHNRKKFPAHEPKDSAEDPALILTNEVAPGGIEFNSASNDFGGTAGDLFIAYYGPGERWNRGGVGRVHITRDADGTYHYTEFPVADLPKLSDLGFGPDGSLYVAQHGRSDYWYNAVEQKTGAFYKIKYDKSAKNWPTHKELPTKEPPAKGALAAGRALFLEQACFACHNIDSGPEQLGPNLNGIGTRLSHAEILEEISEPNKRIKPSMAGVKLTKKNGQNLLGRIVNADQQQVSVMLVGNAIVEIPRAEIATVENQSKSLMPEQMLNRLTKEQIDQLISYLASLE